MSDSETCLAGDIHGHLAALETPNAVPPRVSDNRDAAESP